MKYPLLISEAESVCCIKGNPSVQDIIDIFLKSNIGKLYDLVADDIFKAKLDEPHYYRFKLQVHAQEIVE